MACIQCLTCTKMCSTESSVAMVSLTGFLNLQSSTSPTPLRWSLRWMTMGIPVDRTVTVFHGQTIISAPVLLTLLVTFIVKWNKKWWKIVGNLYTNHSGLMDKFAAFWGLVAQTFADRDIVIGYELMNEPWCGDIYKGRPSMVIRIFQKLWSIISFAFLLLRFDGLPQIQHYCFLGLLTDDI